MEQKEYVELLLFIFGSLIILIKNPVVSIIILISMFPMVAYGYTANDLINFMIVVISDMNAINNCIDILELTVNF